MAKSPSLGLQTVNDPQELAGKYNNFGSVFGFRRYVPMALWILKKTYCASKKTEHGLLFSERKLFVSEWTTLVIVYGAKSVAHKGYPNCLGREPACTTNGNLNFAERLEDRRVIFPA